LLLAEHYREKIRLSHTRLKPITTGIRQAFLIVKVMYKKIREFQPAGGLDFPDFLFQKGEKANVEGNI